MSLTLHIVVCSTRPGRVGLPVAQWFHETAGKHGAFDARLVDLAELNLPIYDEPKHPTLQQYAHEHTKRWSASVSAADAFVRSEEHTSELQSLMRISYAVFCLKKNNTNNKKQR